MSPARRRHRWSRLPKEALLDLRLRDLGLTLEGTWLESCLAQLHEELDRRGIAFRPHAWISHDWYSPDGVPGFAIPFYLVHPRLMRLERSEMLEVEGGTREECLKILRHECAHALDHAYLLHRRRRWQQVFGKSSAPYPEAYRPNPASRRHVRHLRLYYAQAHPDEDFAETFAVWLTPRTAWRRQYEGWPALDKLEYMEELMAEVRTQTPKVRTRRTVDPASRLSTTLRRYYDEKRAIYGQVDEESWDSGLLRIFSTALHHREREGAAAFLRRHRVEIRRTVARWTGQYELALDRHLDQIAARCRELRLRAAGPERQLVLDLAGMLAVRVVHVLYGRRLKIAL